MIDNVVGHLIKALVENPSSVSVVVTQHEQRYEVVINVDPADLGRVIGKEGQTIRAIRSIAELIVPAGYHVSVDIAQKQ